MPDGGQDVREFAVLRPGVVDVVGDHDRQSELGGEGRRFGDQPVVVGREVVRQLDEEPARVRPVTPPEQRRIPFRDRPGTGPVAHPQAPEQLPVATPGEGHEPLRLLGQQRLAEARHALRAGHVRLRHEPAEAPPATRRPGEQHEMRSATPVADPAQVLLHRLAMARQAGPSGSRASRHAVLGRHRSAAPRHRRSRPARSPGPSRDDHDPAGIRDGRIEQSDLQPDDRMQADGLGGAHEPDGAVQSRVVRDGQAGQTQLHGPLDQVVGRGRTVEEREVRVAVELGVRGGCHGVAPVLTGWLGVDPA